MPRGREGSGRGLHARAVVVEAYRVVRESERLLLSERVTTFGPSASCASVLRSR
jgi:hypothetical protein